MIVEEGPRHMRFISLVASLHHGGERARLDARVLLHVQRREGERGRAFKIAGREEASGRQGR